MFDSKLLPHNSLSSLNPHKLSNLQILKSPNSVVPTTLKNTPFFPTVFFSYKASTLFLLDHAKTSTTRSREESNVYLRPSLESQSQSVLISTRAQEQAQSLSFDFNESSRTSSKSQF
ncbi:hypothetical protein NE237_026321 [Protea cynaroides]|uniref:Uncharacterized protein n=1 Tax=Protea cynaroides TaxID=273540 RepID=A0A9Q0K264_9MAGN|nr:hypothetical protein NE237_026321 [Protea cynaroides]